MTPTREQLLERAIQRVMDYDANTDILHGTGLLDELAAALAPQEAAPMPPVNVGTADPDEMLGANGTVWRRP